jgi:hypothetical protein
MEGADMSGPEKDEKRQDTTGVLPEVDPEVLSERISEALEPAQCQGNH